MPYMIAVSLEMSDEPYFRSQDGIGGISFIEVAATKQHDRIGVLCLQLKKLLHHRGKDNIFVHTGISLRNTEARWRRVFNGMNSRFHEADALHKQLCATVSLCSLINVTKIILF